MHLSGVAGQCDGQITRQDEIFRNCYLSFPKGCQVIAAKDSSRCDATRYYFFDTYIVVNVHSPENNCCPKISSTFIHEFCGERTARYQRILLELLHRQFYLIVHTHIIVITEIAMVAAVHSNGNCSDIMRRCNINDGS